MSIKEIRRRKGCSWSQKTTYWMPKDHPEGGGRWVRIPSTVIKHLTKDFKEERSGSTASYALVHGQLPPPSARGWWWGQTLPWKIKVELWCSIIAPGKQRACPVTYFLQQDPRSQRSHCLPKQCQKGNNPYAKLNSWWHLKIKSLMFWRGGGLTSSTIYANGLLKYKSAKTL